MVAQHWRIELSLFLNYFVFAILLISDCKNKHWRKPSDWNIVVAQFIGLTVRRCDYLFILGQPAIRSAQ